VARVECRWDDTHMVHQKCIWKNPDASLNIRSFCSIAIGVKVFLGGNRRPDWVTTYPFGHVHHAVFNKFNGAGCPSTKGDLNIGNDVWISKDVTIMSGVTIGDGGCNSDQ